MQILVFCLFTWFRRLRLIQLSHSKVEFEVFRDTCAITTLNYKNVFADVQQLLPEIRRDNEKTFHIDN